MSVEDKKILRLLQRELHRRRCLDLTDTKVEVIRGVGYISGILRPALGEYLDPKVETKVIDENARRIPGMRDIVIEATWELASRQG